MSISLKETRKKAATYQSLESTKDDVVEVFLPSWVNQHSNLSDGGYRAAILGFSDGMISNLLLILGVQFALEEADNQDAASIVTTGMSGLIASSLSMGIGEWISMKNQSEALRAEIKTEMNHLESYPNEEDEEFLNLLAEHGISKESQKMVQKDLKDAPREKVVELHLKMELGIDPDDTGNPEKAAIFSAIFVSIGSGLPIIPYVFLSHELAWIVSLGLAVFAGAVLGLATGSISGISLWKTALRQVFALGLALGMTLVLNYYLVSMIAN